MPAKKSDGHKTGLEVQIDRECFGINDFGHARQAAG